MGKNLHFAKQYQQERGIPKMSIIDRGGPRGLGKQPAVKDNGPLIIRMFGELEVVKGQEQIEVKGLSGHMSGRLLVHVALASSWGVSRDKVINDLWPYHYGNSAINNFYVAWSRLCKAIGNDKDNFLKSDGMTLRLNHKTALTDTGRFLALYKEMLFGEKDTEEKMVLVAKMERLYRSGVLVGHEEDPFIKNCQERYRELMVEVLLSAVGVYMQQGEQQKARWYAMRAWEIDPRRDDVFKALIESSKDSEHTIIDIRELLGKKIADNVSAISPLSPALAMAAQN